MSNGGDAKAVANVAVEVIDAAKVSGVDSISGVDNGMEVTTGTVSSSIMA